MGQGDPLTHTHTAAAAGGWCLWVWGRSVAPRCGPASFCVVCWKRTAEPRAVPVCCSCCARVLCPCAARTDSPCVPVPPPPAIRRHPTQHIRWSWTYRWQESIYKSCRRCRPSRCTAGSPWPENNHQSPSQETRIGITLGVQAAISIQKRALSWACAGREYGAALGGGKSSWEAPCCPGSRLTL